MSKILYVCYIKFHYVRKFLKMWNIGMKNVTYWYQFFTRCKELVPIFHSVKFAKCERGSFMVWEINMGVCPRLEFDNIMFINCLGYDFYIYGAFEFLCDSIANLWRHVWYHLNTLGYPVIIISKVIDIPCNRREMLYLITISLISTLIL